MNSIKVERQLPDKFSFLNARAEDRTLCIELSNGRVFKIPIIKIQKSNNNQ